MIPVYHTFKTRTVCGSRFGVKNVNSRAHIPRAALMSTGIVKTNSPSSVSDSISPRSAFKKRSPGPAAFSKRIPVREDHGLYAFFRRKEGEDLKGDARFEVLLTQAEKLKVTGRAWTAAEIRLKSFKDLHTLWYVLLREKNLIATQREEARRIGAATMENNLGRDCTKSMSRIKAIMNERRLAYEGAAKLAEDEVEEYHNKQVLQQLLSQHHTVVEEHRAEIEQRRARIEREKLRAEAGLKQAEAAKKRATSSERRRREAERRREKAEQREALQAVQVEQEVPNSESTKEEKLVRAADSIPTTAEATAAGLFGHNLKTI